MRKIKLGWWAPWSVTRPWLPYGWLGTDEWHNPAISVNVPFLGAFHIWFGTWRDHTDGHSSLAPEMDAPDCPICQVWAADEDIPKSWWWNPPRPAQSNHTA